jgi:hypothetical protein
MGAVGKIGEAIARSDTLAVTPEEAIGRFADETVVFKFAVPTRDCVPTDANRLRSIAAGSKYLSVVQAVISQPSAQLDMQRTRPQRRGSPCRRI